ncbi:MAG: PEP-CTERM sorting domain-containing protein [Armatimonadetes bacterium]|nr:PEP-CTERM sorting domain-containing protein [Armatimonadota bacterium]
MKLNSRTLAFALAFGAVAAANAADVRFYLGYGNAAFAAANGAVVGQELNAKSIVPSVGGTFTVSLFAASTITTDAKYGGGAMFIGFDSASTNGTSNYASAAAAEAAGTSKKLKLSTPGNLATGLAGFVGSTQDAGLVDFTLQGAAAYAGRFGSGTSVRPIGVWSAFQFGTSNTVALGAGVALRLADFTVTNAGIAQGETFGDDSGENGLSIESVANSTSRATFFTTTPDRTKGNPGQSVRYQLQVVPEPATMIALATGLVAVARRRRSK